MGGLISLHKLEVFCAVVEQGGVGRAAARLYVSQPVLSGHIRQLETRIGVELFRRAGQRLELTDARHATYTWARETLRRSTGLDRELAGLTSGTGGAVAIATSMTIGGYLLPPILTDFARTNPHARIAVHVLDSDQIWEAVTSALSDLAIPIASRIPYGHGPTGQIRGRQHLVLIAARNASRTPGNEITATDLTRVPFVSTPPIHPPRPRRHRPRRPGHYPPHRHHRVRSLRGHQARVRAGVGAAVLFHTSVATDLANDSLRPVHITGARQRLHVFAVVRTNDHLSPLHRRLIPTTGTVLRVGRSSWLGSWRLA